MIETVPEEAHTLALLLKDVTILNMFNEVKENLEKELKEIRRTMYEQSENLIKKREIIKSNQINSGTEKYN